MAVLTPSAVVTLVNEWGSAPRAEAGESDQPFPDLATVGWPGAEDSDLVRVADLLHPVFAAASPQDRVRHLDALLVRAGVTVRIGLVDDRVAEEWVPARAADGLLVDALHTIRDILGERGAGAIGTCDGQACVDVWIDRPRGRPRRYCSGTCSGRARVAAYRRRQRGTA
ncbi:CGNR zinc finger domain-containing protein [Mumia sp. DW29H23]|uniref:CGNR zinc finger domain-containing protein n=1 Tax=Mumia sp. DW29H23 TaxID=3421241 RepID=UPI003D695E2D